MIDHRTVTYYRARCDGCGCLAPEGASQEEAMSLAAEDGWETVTWWNGLSHVSRHYCPECFEKWESEQEARP